MIVFSSSFRASWWPWNAVYRKRNKLSLNSNNKNQTYTQYISSSRRISIHVNKLH